MTPTSISPNPTPKVKNNNKTMTTQITQYRMNKEPKFYGFLGTATIIHISIFILFCL